MKILLLPENETAYKQCAVPELPRVPCLTTELEQQYLYWLAQQIEHTGAVVEIGTWFGASAGYLALGLRDSNSKQPLYCFDRFTLSAAEKKRVTEQGFEVAHLAVGTDTRPLVLHHLQPLYGPIELIKTDIEYISWQQGPVELLHLDAPKRWQDIAHVLHIFAPFLIPNQTVIVAQDFCMSRAYALPLIFGALQDSFELVHVPSEFGTMAVFVYKKPYVVDTRLDIRTWSVEYAREMIEHWQSKFKNAEQRMLLELGLAFYYFDTGRKELAQTIMSKLS
jgi:hypothetical protein